MTTPSEELSSPGEVSPTSSFVGFDDWGTSLTEMESSVFEVEVSLRSSVEASTLMP